MGSDKVPLLLVTANVGSIFEDPSVMLPIWTSEFLQAVARMDPKFIALHLQEVGGKAYEKSMQYVQDFVQRLYIKIWDFELKVYVDAIGKEIHSGNIEKVTTKEKAKFPQHFFPEVYCRSRRRALRHTLRHLHSDKITEELTACRLQDNAKIDSSRLQYKSKEDRLVLTIGKKEFAHSDHQKIFREPWSARLLVQNQEASRQGENRHLHSSRAAESEICAGGQRRKLVRNQSEGSPKGEALSAELRRLGRGVRNLCGRPASFDGIFVNEIDSTLLSVRPCLDPYTPESIDSHSPNVEASSSSDLEINIEPKKKLNRDRSVSPTQLKNRLDKLLIVDRTIPELQRLNSRESCKSDGSSKGVCFALKCYGFCRRKARKVKCRCSFSCCTS
ncbi:Type I inositol-1,4,5-trisphosphate 5-phosphatase [Operophtera brumata]|uniref:Type I inositol-1,4,5-trisphosphate 5-phosphatase n=1 Tax=Operophtera brumata TaxID=104452 RepID=A0A0L7L3R0_OPEBR|nr:Type I inositol-1,4,5-trisphosphate 5-phosphatase [Operophtera brumata]